MDPLIVKPWQKLLLGGGALALALAAGINTNANRTRLTDPDATLQLRPDDAVALTLREDQRQTDEVLTPQRATAVAEIARRALRADPLTPSALRQIAVARSLEGDRRGTDRLLQLSHDVTRRELGTSWLLIEMALDRGDARAVVRYFDEALTTSLAAPDLMYPALSAALFDSGLRAALVPYVRNISPWMPDLIRYALTQDDAAEHLGALVVASGGLPASPLYAGLEPRILSAVTAKGDFLVARALLRRMPGSAAIVVDPSFAPATTDGRFGPFAWSLVDRQGLSGQRDESGRLHVSVAAGRPERVATRILLLPSGSYRFSQKVEAPDDGVVPAAKWEMFCLSREGTRPAWSLELPVRRTSSHYAGGFALPADCAQQQLSLVVAGGGEQEDAEIIVDSLELTRQ